MTEPILIAGPPKKILLATDLSARCDRALDRTASLAGAWESNVVVVHVLEEASYADTTLPSWRRPVDPVSVARRQLVADVGAVAEAATIRIKQGEPADAVLRVAEAEGCDLIVTGIARNELLGRFNLGRTVERLLRRSSVPVLVVRNRARAPYRHVVVATDFSESSRHALEIASHFFPEQKLTLFHAYDPPLEGVVADSASYRREYRKVAEQDCRAFLKGVAKPARGWRDPDIIIERGDPDSLIREYVRDRQADLVVLGSQGRSALTEVLLGSVAKRIMDSVPCDALVVRRPAAAKR